MGVLGVQGAFASGQAVRIVVLREGTPPAGVHHEDEDREAARAKYTCGFSQSQAGTPPVLADSVSTPDPLFERHFPPAKRHTGSEESAESESDVVEVGRGLANYNSEQIARVKGLNRCVT